MSTQLVPVQFHDDTLEAALTTDRGVAVPLRAPCKALGLDYDGQLQRLTDPDRSPWATTFKMKVVAEDKKLRELTFVDLDTLAMWLATITPGKVDARLRPKIVRYQKECARVLRAHFFGSSGDTLLDSIREIQRSAGAIAEVRERQLTTEREVAEVRVIAEGAQATAVAALNVVGNRHGYLTILGYCRLTKREVGEREALSYGRQAARLCRERAIVIREVGSERYGKVNSYPESILREIFGDDGDEPLEF